MGYTTGDLVEPNFFAVKTTTKFAILHFFSVIGRMTMRPIRANLSF